MATVDQHSTQWNHNRRFASTVDRKFTDWQITAIFYTALHAVNAALTHLGVKVTDHEERNEAVRNNAALATIREGYLNLYRISKITRYDCDPDAWLPHKYLTVADLADHILKPIELEVERLLGKSLKLPKLEIEK